MGSDRPFKLLTKSLCPLPYSRQKKGRTRATKAKISYKSDLKKFYWSMMIMHIILVFMGNDLQNWFMTYLWFGIKMKHLSVWSFIHLCAVFPYSVGPSVSSNAPLEAKCKCLKSHYRLWEILSVCFHSSFVSLFLRKCVLFWSVWGFASLPSVFAF